MTGKAKTVRFSEEDEKLINEFLLENTIFDFSLLARTAILNFIENPEMKIKPVSRMATKNIERAEKSVLS
jgi:hypothetical protein